MRRRSLLLLLLEGGRGGRFGGLWCLLGLVAFRGRCFEDGCGMACLWRDSVCEVCDAGGFVRKARKI